MPCWWSTTPAVLTTAAVTSTGDDAATGEGTWQRPIGRRQPAPRRGAGAWMMSLATLEGGADKLTHTSSPAGGALRAAAPAPAADGPGAGAAPGVVDRPADLQPRGFRRRPRVPARLVPLPPALGGPSV